MVQTPAKALTLAEFLKLPETKPASEYIETKVTKNILYCLKYETQMGWLIDPEEQSVFVYLPDQATDVYDQPEARLPVPEFAKDFSLTVKELFGWLLD